MRLYYATATCSHAVHIALREAGLEFALTRMDMKTHQLEDGRSIRDVNPKGFVPVLELDDGTRLTEVPAVLQYVADQRPERALAPANGTLARYRLQEWLNFVATEIHKIYWPLFHEGAEVEKQHALEKLAASFDHVQDQLGERDWLLESGYSVADAYLVTTLNWTRAAGIDLNRWPTLAAYRLRVRERPAVNAALEAEGLLRKK